VSDAANTAVIAFALSAAFVFYVLLGYPALLWLLALWNKKPIRKHFEEKTVSVILPVRNGDQWIRAKLQSILALDYPKRLMEILVISDSSEDRTDDIVRQFADERVQLLRIPRSGKATALNKGMERARGEILFFTDVRQTLEPGSLRNLVACLGDPTVGVASGELIIRNGNSREHASVSSYWRYEKWIRKQLSRVDSTIGVSGCIWAMRREFAVTLPPETLLDDVHLPLVAFFRGYRVVLDESARAYDYPASLHSEFRRKVRTLAGNYQIIGQYPALLGPANRMWIHFVSHKLGRLLLPFALGLMAIVSFGLPGMWAAFAVSVQAFFYCFAALDLLVPESSFVKRLSSPARTFVVLMAASLFAVSIFFLPGQSFWKSTKVEVPRAA